MRLATDSFDQLNAVRLLGHAYRGQKDAPAEIHALRLTLEPDDPFATGRLRDLGQEPRGFTPEEMRSR